MWPMLKYVIFVVLLWATAELVHFVDASLYFIVDNVKTFECAGAPGLIAVNHKDVVLTDVNGRKVHYIEAPGTYVLQLHRVEVKRELAHLSADLSIVGQATVGNEGPLGLNLDVSQSLLPEKKMFRPTKCDRNSGVVTDLNGMEMCRYCDICSVAKKATNEMNRMHNYLAKTDSRDLLLKGLCSGIKEGTPHVSLRFSLPEAEVIQQHVSTVAKANALKAGTNFKIGTWKLRAFVRLNSHSKPVTDANQFYTYSRKCASCAVRHDECSESCKSEYANHCFQGTSTSVACVTVEFTAKVTDRYSDVQAYLQKHSYADHRKPSWPKLAQQTNRLACISAIANPATRKYCNIQWNEIFCCSQCGGRCRPRT